MTEVPSDLPGIIDDTIRLFTAVAALGAALMSYWNNRKLTQLHKATNSLTDKLVETTRAEAHAAGAKEERDRDKTGD